jgi:hypothetical protein
MAIVHAYFTGAVQLHPMWTLNYSEVSLMATQYNATALPRMVWEDLALTCMQKDAEERD